jgi:hypothetical protein
MIIGSTTRRTALNGFEIDATEHKNDIVLMHRAGVRRWAKNSIVRRERREARNALADLIGTGATRAMFQFEQE